MSAAPTRSKVSLKGSSKIVAEFFEYSINSILYQRGIYPPEDFQLVKKYNLNVLITIDAEVKSYIRKIIGQLHKWLVSGKISKLVVAIVSKASGEVIELWQFDVSVLQQPESSATAASVASEAVKPLEQIQKEIQAIIRQITASITFLPVLDAGQCTFNVQVYADASAQVPAEWADSDAKEIKNGEQVQLRSFSTDDYEVSTLVAYKLGVDEN
ncbi:similar to Saccharomyces cerevisiae YJL030W MAD2 Component of the spindle-assembly checkpoint complex [Geotrichum candidum]|uniref:Similar to Saccharomyces cerevisiae YJL030W MAD2 Component of the spindle-assembly checkpoint complex n=1 Tax=Geotrichum candidum TaxID=1173061 RepID=A0A0J9XL33_GEOCN|nr:similar to Saccharomyces cerevisiae YJL030W MAD2 Component of the spindle-assembly checkpoint complex [Geotrichum candidum]